MSTQNTKYCWLIWSNEHKGWWKSGNHGYTRDVASAARFTFEEACEKLHDANRYHWFCLAEPNETMVPITSLPDTQNSFTRETGWKEWVE